MDRHELKFLIIFCYLNQSKNVFHRSSNDKDALLKNNKRRIEVKSPKYFQIGFKKLNGLFHMPIQPETIDHRHGSHISEYCKVCPWPVRHRWGDSRNFQMTLNFDEMLSILSLNKTYNDLAKKKIYGLSARFAFRLVYHFRNSSNFSKNSFQSSWLNLKTMSEFFLFITVEENSCKNNFCFDSSFSLGVLLKVKIILIFKVKKLKILKNKLKTPKANQKHC
jgi:hypothetical protein